ncbi:aldehyde dehydrogenase family protein, partial [Burkholderia pseudomallei]
HAHAAPRHVPNPAHLRDAVGTASEATPDEVSPALAHAVAAAPIWQATPLDARAHSHARAADLLQAQIHTLKRQILREPR